MKTVEPRHPKPRAAEYTVEYATLNGLEEVAAEELRQSVRPVGSVSRPRPGFLRVGLADLSLAERPRVSGVAYLTRHYPVSRPRALLGNEHLTALVADVREVVGRLPGGFTSLRISAAGAESAVLQRLAAEVAAAVALPTDAEGGDLVIRVFPEENGWTTGVRLTPRPLSARPWQTPGFAGALEATVAAAMIRLSQPEPDDVFVDACCGSGTIAIERSLAGPARLVVGVDTDAGALGAFARNIASARPENVLAVRGDATRLPLDTGTASVVAANPPWGHQMGTDTSTRLLYPALLEEAARVTAPGARFVLLSHQVRLTQDLLAVMSQWSVLTEHRVAMRGHHPRIWVLRHR